MNDLQSLEEYDSDYKELSGNLSEAYYVLEDVTKQLGDFWIIWTLMLGVYKRLNTA